MHLLILIPVLLLTLANLPLAVWADALMQRMEFVSLLKNILLQFHAFFLFGGSRYSYSSCILSLLLYVLEFTCFYILEFLHEHLFSLFYWMIQALPSWLDEIDSPWSKLYWTWISILYPEIRISYSLLPGISRYSDICLYESFIELLM